MGSIPLGVYEIFQRQSLEHYDSMKEFTIQYFKLKQLDYEKYSEW